MSIKAEIGTTLLVIAALRKDNLITAKDIQAVSLTSEGAERIAKEFREGGHTAVILSCMIEQIHTPNSLARQERKKRQQRAAVRFSRLKKVLYE